MMALIKKFALTFIVLYAGQLICLWAGGELMADMFLAASLAIIALDLLDAINDEILED